MQLNLGKMTGQELAEWFNIRYKSYANQRKQKLKILKRYAEFTEHRGGVEITKIHYDTYITGFQEKKMMLFI